MVFTTSHNHRCKKCGGWDYPSAADLLNPNVKQCYCIDDEPESLDISETEDPFEVPAPKYFKHCNTCSVLYLPNASTSEGKCRSCHQRAEDEGSDDSAFPALFISDLSLSPPVPLSPPAPLSPLAPLSLCAASVVPTQPLCAKCKVSPVLQGVFCRACRAMRNNPWKEFLPTVASRVFQLDHKNKMGLPPDSPIQGICQHSQQVIKAIPNSRRMIQRECFYCHKILVLAIRH